MTTNNNDTQNATTTTNTGNNTSRFITGVVAGAAIAYLLTNKKFQQNASVVIKNLLGTAGGEIDELKERLADAQAELDYYRQKDQE